jgi:hypothetical protein
MALLGATVWRRALGVDRATVIEEIDSRDSCFNTNSPETPTLSAHRCLLPENGLSRQRPGLGGFKG